MLSHREKKGIKSVLKPQVFPVTDNVYCMRHPSYFVCSYFIVTGNGVVLIDAGIKSNGRDFEYALSVVGKAVKDVRAILLTHWHNDHAAGASFIKSQSGARVYYHQKEAPYFTRQTASTGIRARLSDRVPEFGPLILLKGLLGTSIPCGVEASEFVTDGMQIEEEFSVIETHGHTPGHVCYFYQPKRILFAGDALAVVGNQIRFMSRPTALNLANCRESMKRCLEIEFDFLCPGHRKPLSENLPTQRNKLLEYINNNGKWPLFG